MFSQAYTPIFLLIQKILNIFFFETTAFPVLQLHRIFIFRVNGTRLQACLSGTQLARHQASQFSSSLAQKNISLCLGPSIITYHRHPPPPHLASPDLKVAHRTCSPVWCPKKLGKGTVSWKPPGWLYQSIWGSSPNPTHIRSTHANCCSHSHLLSLMPPSRMWGGPLQMTHSFLTQGE